MRLLIFAAAVVFLSGCFIVCAALEDRIDEPSDWGRRGAVLSARDADAARLSRCLASIEESRAQCKNEVCPYLETKMSRPDCEARCDRRLDLEQAVVCGVRTRAAAR